MKSRFYFFFRLVVLLFFGNALSFADEVRSSQNQTPFQIFETQVYPFLQQKCAGCHGDNQFAAPQHSPRNDAQTSYKKIRGYVHFAPDWETSSRLITFGGTRHCKEYTGDDSCGADHSELVSTVRNWIEAEISVKAIASAKQIRTAKEMLPSFQEKITKSNKRFLKIIQVAASAGRTCVLFENRKAKCWGANSFSQLGLGAASAIGDTSVIGDSPEEMKFLPYVMIKEPIKQISVSIEHTCVLLENGKAKCWGANYVGQLGIGSKAPVVGKTPQEMESLPDVMIKEPIVQISAGGTHTCALLQSGKAKCWGSNNLGQLGIGSKAQNVGMTSQEMKSLPDVMIQEPITQITAASGYTCALLKSERAKCWGYNSLSGFLGIGSKVTSLGKTPQEMKSLPDVMINEPIKQISIGAAHSCALLQNRKAKCWGLNDNRQLGVAVPKDSLGSDPQEMKNLPYVLIDEPIQYIAAGTGYSCALLQNETGTVKCWGKNFHGQIGIGSLRGFIGITSEEMKNLTPVLVNKKILQISMGYEYTCFLVEDGKVRCTGENKSGELGTGDRIDRGIYDVDGTDELSDALVTAEEE